jgi:hypothetical protein
MRREVPNVPQLEVDGGAGALDGLEGEIHANGGLVRLGELVLDAPPNDGGLTRADVAHLGCTRTGVESGGTNEMKRTKQQKNEAK